MPIFTISFINFHLFSVNYIFFGMKYYKIIPRMGIFLNGLLEPKKVLYRHTTHLVSSSNDRFLHFQIVYRLLVLDTTLSHLFQSDTHHFPSLDTTHFELVFVLPWSPVLIKLQLLKLAR